MKRPIALVGIGKIAVDQHVPSLAASEDWELAATVSRSGGVPGVEAFGDIAGFLAARPEVRTVSLCVPPAPRFAIAEAALKAGRHVMLEKPSGASLAECHALEALARASGVSLYASWHSREAAMVEPARVWLADKAIWRLAITWKEDVRRWHPGQDWIWRPGGLGVFDPGINALSILTRILPQPVRLSAARLSFPENCETPIAASLAFAYPGGAEMRAEFDFRQEGDQTWTIEAETEAGTLLLSDGGAKLAIDGAPCAAPAGDGAALAGEYPRLYANMAVLVADSAIDMDLAPMVLVADAFLLGERVVVEPFHE